MAKKIINKKFLSAILFCVFLFIFMPVLSSAQEAIDTTCKPENQFNQDQICIFDRNEGGEYLDLKWNISGDFGSNPFCILNCIKSQNDTTPCDQGGTVTYTKNVNGADVPAGGNPGDHALTPADNVSIYLRDASPRSYDGNVYQAVCMHRDNNGKADGNAVYSQKMTVEVPAKCEVPFSLIQMDLYPQSGAMQPAHITENNLKGWVGEDDDDFAGAVWDDANLTCSPSTKAGSGDVRDVQCNIIDKSCKVDCASPYGSYQCQQSNSLPADQTKVTTYNYWPTTSFLGKSIDYAIKWVYNRHYPMGLSFHLPGFNIILSNGTFLQEGFTTHKVVVIGISGSPTQGYDFDIIDPNTPNTTTTLGHCLRADWSISYGKTINYYSGLMCDNIPSAYSSLKGPALIQIDNNFSGFDFEDNYATALEGLCSSANGADYPDLCGRKNDIDSWLKSNLTDFQNPNIQGGVCGAWSDFMIKVAFYGDFSDVDYHPDDHKYVGIDCDANHHSLTPTGNTTSLAKPATIARNSSWESWLASSLANILNGAWQFLKSIKF